MNDETIEGSFTQWFNTHGFLDKKALRRWLAGNIEVIALADPEAKKEWDAEREEERVDEEVVSAGAVRAGATGTELADDSNTRTRGRPKKV